MSTTNAILKGLFKSGLSQAEIARRTGIPQPRLSKWGGGAVPAAADEALVLANLADELGVEPCFDDVEEGQEQEAHHG